MLRMVPGKYFPRALAYVLLSGLARLGWRGQENFALPAKLQPCFRKVGSEYRSFPPAHILPAPDFAVQLKKSGHSWEYIYCDPLDRQAISRIHHAGETVDTLIVCLPEMDHAGHVFGPTGEWYRQSLLKFDLRLTDWIKGLEGSGPPFSLFIFSDHGMTRVDRSFDVWKYLEKAGFRLGEDYLAFLNSTIVSLWSDHGHREEIISKMNACGAGHILTKADRECLHLQFPDNRYGDEIFVMEEGIECVPNFISLAHRQGKGMHGYDPGLPSTRAFFIGENQIVGKPRDIIGIHSVLEEVMLSRTGRSILPGKEENHVQP